MKEIKLIPQSQLIAHFNKVLEIIKALAPELMVEYSLPEKVNERGICFGLTMIAAFVKTLSKQKQSDQFDLLYWIAELKDDEIADLVKSFKKQEESEEKSKFSCYELITLLKKINFEQNLHDFNITYRFYSKGIGYEFVNCKEEQGNWEELSKLLKKTLVSEGFWRICLSFSKSKHSIAIFVKNGQLHFYDCNKDISVWFGPYDFDELSKFFIKKYKKEKVTITADLIRPHRENSDFYRQVNLLFQWQKLQFNGDESIMMENIEKYDQDLISQVDFSRRVVYYFEHIPEKSRDYFAEFIYKNLAMDDFNAELKQSLRFSGATERLLKAVSPDDMKKINITIAVAAAKLQLVNVLKFFPAPILQQVHKAVAADEKIMPTLTRVVLHKIDPHYPLAPPSFLQKLNSNIPSAATVISKMTPEQVVDYGSFFPETQKGSSIHHIITHK